MLMKKRRSIFWFVCIVAVLIAVVIWLERKPAEATSPTVAETNVVPQPSTARIIIAASPPKHAPLPTNVPVAPVSSGAPTTPLTTKAEQMKEGLAEFNNEDVVLYGKVMDQFDAPIANATVAGSVQVNNGTREGTDKISVATDANGLFTVSGYKGKALGINVRKAGYVMATTNTRFIYSLLWSDAERYHPDPSNPVVIKMWKLQGSEPLTGINQRHKFHFTETPINFDLLAGKIVSDGGDIKLTMSRATGFVSERTMQDWSVQIEAVDGGLIETPAMESRITYALPSSGYQPNDTFILSTNAPHQWSGSIDQMYFIQSRNGQVFTKVDISVTINQQPDDFVWVEFHGEANPNGSRNFEADASAMTMKPQ